MKLNTSGWLFSVLIVLLAMSVGASAESLAVRNCTWCHGSSAQGYTPAPQLAGQRRGYIEEQIASFRGHARDNPEARQYMWGATANLDPQTARELAAYFAALAPRPANDGRSELVAAGRSIYQNGMPEANIVACVVCHGPNAEGVGNIPRLGGLSYDYLKRRLEDWASGYHSSARHPMPSVARKLTTGQVDSLASYLSFISSDTYRRRASSQ